MVVGTLRGFDQFMNLVVDNTVEVNGDDKTDIGMVVSLFNTRITASWVICYRRPVFTLYYFWFDAQVIRGNSIVTVEALEPVGRSS